MSSDKRERLWSSLFVALVALSLCTFFVGQGSNSGTSVFIDRAGGTAAFAGFLALVFSGSAAVARLVSGPIIDIKGRAIVMGCGSIIMLTGTLGPVFTTEGAWFVLWRFLQGTGFSMVTTASATAAADVLPASRLGEGIGYFGLGQAIAMSIGPACALFLVSTDPATNLYLGLGVSAVLSVVLVVMCRYEKHPDRLPETSAYRVIWEKRQEATTEDTGKINWKEALNIFEPGALAGAVPIMFLCFAFGFGIFFTGLFGTELGVTTPGLFYTISAIAMIIVRLSSGRFMDTVPAIKIMSVSVATGIVGFVMLLVASLQVLDTGATELVYYAAGAPYGICLGLSLPCNNTVAVKNSPQERWGAANALFFFAIDIGNGIASLMWGAINDALGFTASIIGVILFIALGFASACLLYPSSEKGRETSWR